MNLNHNEPKTGLRPQKKPKLNSKLCFTLNFTFRATSFTDPQK